jgi:hypothetical protein
VLNIGLSCYQWTQAGTPKACYNVLVRLDNAGNVTWATHIKTLVYQFGFGYVWISQEVVNAQYCV